MSGVTGSYYISQSPAALRAALAQDISEVNVLRFGADPNGGNSSLAAFNLAHAFAMAATPHLAMRIPVGQYLIPSPGLSWSDSLDIRIRGDGPEQSLLVGDATGGYTILTISQDHGGGTTGSYLNLSEFGIKNNPAATAQHALALADYNYATLTNMVLFASGNALSMAGMANYVITNVNGLTWQNNAAGNSALVMKADTAGIFCGPGLINGGQFEGVGAVTTGAAINSTGSYGLTVIGTQIVGLGPSLVSVVEFANKDDVTWIDGYSESCANTTANTAVIFFLGRSLAPINFTLIGGTYNSGDGGGHFCNLGILGNQINAFMLINTTWNNFITAAVNAATSGGASIMAFGNKSNGAGAPPVFSPAMTGAPAGQAVPFWFAPALVTGWGVPTGPAVVAGFAGAGDTLIHCSNAIAKIITDLKTLGIYGN